MFEKHVIRANYTGGATYKGSYRVYKITVMIITNLDVIYMTFCAKGTPALVSIKGKNSVLVLDRG